MATRLVVEATDVGRAAVAEAGALAHQYVELLASAPGGAVLDVGDEVVVGAEVARQARERRNPGGAEQLGVVARQTVELHHANAPALAQQVGERFENDRGLAR